LDDLVLVPLGVVLALRMIPSEVLAECREQAEEVIREGKPVSRVAALVVVAVWILLAALAVALVVRIARGPGWDGGPLSHARPRS